MHFVEPQGVGDVLEWTIELAKTAGTQAQQFFGTQLTRTVKSHQNDYATEADVAVEKTIVQAIQERYPGDGILAEESGVHGIAGAQNVWVIDPIDGTSNFANRDPEWGVMIARTDGDAVQLAVVHCPEIGLTAWASRGEGTFLNGTSVRAPEQSKSIDDASIILGKTFDPSLRKEIQVVRDYCGPTLGRAFSYHSAATNTLHLLNGEHDGYAVNAMKTWDTIGPSLLFQEAGYTMTLLQGGAYHWKGDDQSLLAAHPQLHSQLCEIIPRP
jgi:myo-inositol-1(or 4)-monophosphatase